MPAIRWRHHQLSARCDVPHLDTDAQLNKLIETKFEFAH